MAISGGSGQVAGTTALPPATDIRAPKSAFALISSAVPPGADSQDGGAVGPEVTQVGRPGQSRAEASSVNLSRQNGIGGDALSVVFIANFLRRGHLLFTDDC